MPDHPSITIFRHEDWPHGLEAAGGAALCRPCIDALDGGDHAG